MASAFHGFDGKKSAKMVDSTKMADGGTLSSASVSVTRRNPPDCKSGPLRMKHAWISQKQVSETEAATETRTVTVSE